MGGLFGCEPTLPTLMTQALFGFLNVRGGVAQMVERSLSMREVPGSIPGASNNIFSQLTQVTQKTYASSGNRTRAACVAGKHSTTEPAGKSLSQSVGFEPTLPEGN